MGIRWVEMRWDEIHDGHHSWDQPEDRKLLRISTTTAEEEASGSPVASRAAERALIRPDTHVDVVAVEPASTSGEFPLQIAI